MNEDKIIDMLIKHESDVEYVKENMVVKEDVKEISSTLDKILLRYS